MSLVSAYDDSGAESDEAETAERMSEAAATTASMDSSPSEEDGGVSQSSSTSAAPVKPETSQSAEEVDVNTIQLSAGTDDEFELEPRRRDPEPVVEPEPPVNRLLDVDDHTEASSSPRPPSETQHYSIYGSVLKSLITFTPIVETLQP